ncbi:protein adenylyltransferase SelO [Sulfurimonas sp.]
MKFSDVQLTTPYLELDALFYDKVQITPLAKPFLIAASQDAAKLLGIDEDLALDEELVKILNGEAKLHGSQTFAMCYAGHQFGYFVPRLGDGRAVLRSSIREFLMSEAMHGLGIATSRALALIGSDTNVARERWEKGAMVLRLSPTWVRFGTFEYFNAKGKHEKLQQLADYVIAESFPELQDTEGRYLKMYAKVVANTAKTVAKWQAYGFNHGVMNTDNMSIDGRTIDYGPFAFLDDYESNYICNHTDQEGRYSFKNQPGIAHWNLTQLARALSPIVNYDGALLVLEEMFGSVYEREYIALMCQRLGLYETDEKDLELIQWLLGTLQSAVIDYNLFFRKLCTYQGNTNEILDIAIYREDLKEWLNAYEERLQKEQLTCKEREARMLHVNPKYILKNHILQEAIDKAEKDDFSMVQDLLSVALAPFDAHKELEYLAKPTPQSAKNVKLSCSS